MGKEETKLQHEIQTALEKYGMVIRMNTGRFRARSGQWVKNGVKGFPDLMLLTENRAVFVEVKTPTGKPSPEQLDRIAKLHSYGHIAGICRSVEEAEDLVREAWKRDRKEEEEES